MMIPPDEDDVGVGGGDDDGIGDDGDDVDPLVW